MTNKAVGILGIGSYVPEKVLTNYDLEKMVDTSDEWILARTGIKERRIASKETTTSDLAVKAAEKAIKDAEIDPKAIQMIIISTVTGDYPFPSTACIVQKKLGLKNLVAFDITAACSGFIYGLETARQFIMSGMYDKVLVIGAEKMTSVTDWQDRATCVLLGDGAGAAVVGKVDEGKGILGTYMRTDGAHEDLLKMPGGGSAYPATVETVNKRMHFMKMEGREVFKHAVTVMCSSAIDVIKQCGLKREDIDLIVPHQANVRILKAIEKRLKTEVYVNVDRFGNTSAASIPIALDEAINNGVIKKGQKILLVAFGAGLTWGANIIQF